MKKMGIHPDESKPPIVVADKSPWEYVWVAVIRGSRWDSARDSLKYWREAGPI